MGKYTITRIVKKSILRCGLDNKPITPHKLRHTYATLLYQKGTDVFTLQELLGHNEIESTRLYAHVSTQKKKEAIDKLR